MGRNVLNEVSIKNNKPNNCKQISSVLNRLIRCHVFDKHLLTWIRDKTGYGRTKELIKYSNQSYKKMLRH